MFINMQKKLWVGLLFCDPPRSWKYVMYKSENIFGMWLHKQVFIFKAGYVWNYEKMQPFLHRTYAFLY